MKSEFCKFTNNDDNKVVIDLESDDEVVADSPVPPQRRRSRLLSSPICLSSAAQTENSNENDAIKDDESRELKRRKDDIYRPDQLEVENLMQGLNMDDSRKICEDNKGKASMIETPISDDKGKPIELDSASISRIIKRSVSRTASKKYRESGGETKKNRIKTGGIFSGAGRSSIRLSSMKKTAERSNKRSLLGKRNSTKVGASKSTAKVLRTRTSPRTLHETIGSLNKEQRIAVEEMGLGSLLSMSVDGVPTKLGYFVVDKLDTKKMILELSNENIPITVDSIHAILGLPNDGIDLIEDNEILVDDTITDMWKEQFSKKRIRPKDVQKLIMQSNDAGFIFKKNFIVLFVNMMAECNSMGTCTLNFLPKLTSEKMLPKIHWSKFIYDKLKGSKQWWRREDNMCFYSGPLTYLMV